MKSRAMRGQMIQESSSAETIEAAERNEADDDRIPKRPVTRYYVARAQSRYVGDYTPSRRRSMKNQPLRFTLYAIIIYLTCGTLNPAVAVTRPFGGNETHFCGVIDSQLNKQHSDQFPNRHYARTFAANLNVGEPRTVRMIYFLPNDRPYRANVVQRMKGEILNIQTFYAEQMDAHGYGKITFRVESDVQGEPIVHRVDGKHSDSYYIANHGYWQEIEQKFDLRSNVYCLVWDNSTNSIESGVGGIGARTGKNGGTVTITGAFDFGVMDHELGHAFGLPHNFRDGSFIMSYGPGKNRLSPCSAKYLSVHPYFNSDIPIEEGEPPIVELISPRTYPAGAQSVPVRLKVSDSDGLHQVLLHGSDGLVDCHGLEGERDAFVEFDYDGTFRSSGFISLTSLVVHSIYVTVVDTDGNVGGSAPFALTERSSYHITTIKGHTDAVNFVTFPRDGETLASGSREGMARLWDVATQQNIATLNVGSYSVAFSTDGKKIASGSYDDIIMLWDVATQQNIGTFEGHTSQVGSVAFSTDGKVLASGSYDGTTKLWDVATQQNIGTFEGHTSQVRSVAFSTDGKVLASGSYDGTTKLWDVATQQNIDTLEGDGFAPWINSVAFSPDGAILAIGQGDALTLLSGTVRLWEVSTGRILASFVPHLDGVTAVSFSRDGTVLASGSRDGTVKLWDMTTQGNFATLGHTSEVHSVSFSPDGRTFASGTLDGTIELWDTSILMGARLEMLAEIDIPDPNLHAAIVELIGLSPNASMLRGHLRTLTYLDAKNANISDLTGLEDATNLRILDLNGEYVETENRWINSNSVSDFSPLMGLTKLTALYLRDSNISDISSVAGLTSLTSLDFANNSISDISAVSGLTDLRNLGLWGNSISDISAVSGLTDLRNLELGFNSISDISAVSGLTQLTRLVLPANNVSDISAVAGLTKLIDLGLGGNSISDISAVSGLTDLKDLRLFNNSISDISAISGLTNLRTLNLGGNSISDISAVSGLTQLTYLNLSNNAISDVSPLLELNLTGTPWDSTGLDLRNNPLSYASINSHIPAIQAKGIDVKFYNQAHPALLKISGDNQNGASFISLSQPFVVEARDENGFPLAGISVTFAVTKGGGTLNTTTTKTDPNGRAQSTLILGPNLGANTVSVSAAGIESTATFYAIADSELPPTAADVNSDGLVNVLDLILIASNLGQSGQNDADVNRDGVVNVLDLILVAGMFDNAAAAPSVQPQVPETLTAVEVQNWLADARTLEIRDPIMKQGVIMLEQLLVSLTPKETELLANYPNPFNPETWIPYRLAEDTFVTLTIYDGSGQVVRTLNVGHRIAAVYENRLKAIYWDGRNGLGERVASGIYFYQLSAGDYSATRKMLILK